MSNKLDFSKELIGHRALVTGGSRGIGAAIAQRLLDAGAKVAVGAGGRRSRAPTTLPRRRRSSPATSPRAKAWRESRRRRSRRSADSTFS
jgi:NAD(P)-dependent dehydrogenase (short-subunit alcohol dehydrogenase family)